MENETKCTQKCANCSNWHPLPEFSIVQDQIKKTIISNKKLNNTCGICQAKYIDRFGHAQPWEEGSFGEAECFATDDKGNNLFSPRP